MSWSSALSTMDKGLEKAIETAGGVRALARKLGIRHSAILTWKRVPAHRMLEVEQATGVPREVLRPDFFRSKVRT